MDMGTHIETIILIFRSVRVTLTHFKVIQKTLKITLMRLDETQRETIKHKVIMPMSTEVTRIKFLLSNRFCIRI